MDRLGLTLASCSSSWIEPAGTSPRPPSERRYQVSLTRSPAGMVVCCPSRSGALRTIRPSLESISTPRQFRSSGPFLRSNQARGSSWISSRASSGIGSSSIRPTTSGVTRSPWSRLTASGMLRCTRISRPSRTAGALVTSRGLNRAPCRPPSTASTTPLRSGSTSTSRATASHMPRPPSRGGTDSRQATSTSSSSPGTLPSECWPKAVISGRSSGSSWIRTTPRRTLPFLASWVPRV